MKMLLTALLLWAMIFSVAIAEETEVTLGLQVLSVKDTDGDKGFKFDVKNIQKGIYVHAWDGIFSTAPHSEELIKEILKAKGIKVADKIEDADFGIQIRGGDKFGTFGGVEDDIGSYTKGEAFARNVLTNFAVIVVTGRLNSQRGSRAIDGTKPVVADLYVKVMRNPQNASMKKIKGDDEKEVLTELLCHVNRPAKKGEGFQPMLLSSMFVGFVEQHFEGLPAPDIAPATAPASAVTPATPVAAN